jgi:hypothetical protein
MSNGSTVVGVGVIGGWGGWVRSRREVGEGDDVGLVVTTSTGVGVIGWGSSHLGLVVAHLGVRGHSSLVVSCGTSDVAVDGFD